MYKDLPSVDLNLSPVAGSCPWILAKYAAPDVDEVNHPAQILILQQKVSCLESYSKPASMFYVFDGELRLWLVRLMGS